MSSPDAQQFDADFALPATMSKHRVIGEGIPREWVYCARDRVDEAFDCARSVRNGRWLYIRNFYPHLGWNQPSAFSDLGEIRQEITRYFDGNGPSSAGLHHYAQPYRDYYEFYDCLSDPENLDNLSLYEMTREQLDAFEDADQALKKFVRQTHDTGCLPEGIMTDLIKKHGKPIANVIQDGEIDLNGIWNVVESIGTHTEIPLRELSSTDPAKRFWSIIALRNFPSELSKGLRTSKLLGDPVPEVRIAAASWLAERNENFEPALNLLIKELDHPIWAVALRACRAIELLGNSGKPALPAMKELYARTRNTPGDASFFLAFSSGAFLEKLGEETIPWDFTPGAGSFMPPKK